MQVRLHGIKTYDLLIEEKPGYPDRMLIHTLGIGKNPLKETHKWDDCHMSADDSTLVLGVDMLMRKVSIDLNKTPQVLLGGSTGSGKSQLQLLAEMQGIKKEWSVTRIDMKGGVDVPNYWMGRCEIVTDIDTAIETLSAIVAEMERRKKVLLDAGCKNVRDYNASVSAGEKLSRILVSVDELAQLTDTTGRDKTAKEKSSAIIGHLSVIATLGRAFSINLLLSTQRPSADIVPGQIRNNMDFRCCGRAESVLSQIILDNSDASERIPKDAQGLFLTNDGRLFKAFLLNDDAQDTKEGD